MLRHPSTYKHLAIDAWWRIRGASGPPAGANLSWPLDPDRVAGVTVRWPTTYLSGSAGLQSARDSRIARRLASLRLAMGNLVRSESADIPQPYASVVLLEVVVEGTRYQVAVDQSPYLEIKGECADRCLLYFKRHHQVEGYGRSNVIPGGFAPLKHQALHRYLDQLRRFNRKTHDVYARFSPHFSPAVREPALRKLSEQDSFEFEGGTRRTMYSQYLREIASSRICIDLPGEGPFTYRLVEYLAVGSCIVAYPHRARLHVPLVDREHVVYTKEDLSDLVDICTQLLRDSDERKRLAANARDYFDRYLHPRQLAAYHLHSILERVSAPALFAAYYLQSILECVSAPAL